MSRISAIIPMYNAQDYITEALDSVIRQTYPVHEIIVVDDGSTDNGKKKVEDFGTDKGVTIKYFYQNNAGPAAARNRGIKEASGEYIAFLDSDDLWEPTKLAKQLLRLQQNPAAALCFTDMSHVVDGKIVYVSYLHHGTYRHLGEGNIYEDLLRNNFIFTPTVLVKKEALSKIGVFDEGLRIAEDYDLWLRIAREFPVCFTDEALVTRRRTGNNITADTKHYIENNIMLYQKLLQREASVPHRCRIIKRRLQYNRYILGYVQFVKELFPEARRSFISVLNDRKFMLKSLFYIILTFLPIKVVRGLRGLQRNLK